MPKKTAQSSPKLVGENARRSDVDQPWEQDNQAWWDWYMTLADNSGEPAPAPERLASQPAASVADGLDAAADIDVASIRGELSTPYALTPDQIDSFRANGYIKLPRVLSPGATRLLRGEMVRLLGDAFDTRLDGGTKGRFLSLELAWLEHRLMRAFVLSARIAKLAADLLGVPRVRLYHDNLMSKEPGCGRTPWHYDAHHFPLATNDVVTAWIPAQPIPRDMGPLCFAWPIDVHKLVEGLAFSKFDTSYDRRILEVFREREVAVDDGPFEAGMVSFHHNLCFHSAGANGSGQSRVVLANTFYADGARVLERPTMVSGDWQKFIPGAAPGAVAASELNPVCWPPEA
ncbi:phytanoyl-CoA dioxygenase family protein [Thiorhodococcus minor]|nr:phytanoyl-CoA dioxygenase family protein [Thiorhodococcus minor]